MTLETVSDEAGLISILWKLEISCLKLTTDRICWFFLLFYT